MQFGLSTGFLKYLTANEIIDLCLEAKTDIIEIWDHDGYFAESRDYWQDLYQLSKSDIKVNSLHSVFIPDSLLDIGEIASYLERFRLTCEKASIFKASYVVVHPVVITNESSSLSRADSFLEFISHSVWKRQTEIAIEYQLSAAFENLPPTPGWPSGCTVSTIVNLVDSIPHNNVGCCFDISHAFACGQDPLNNVDILEDRNLLGLHISDGIYGVKEDKHLSPGSGTLNWCLLFQKLSQIGFHKTAVLEVADSRLNSIELEKIMDFLNHNLTERGDKR